ncbi:MAG: EAL domain-containing protein [Acidimicrobiia bacterium]|nr:EAL domain-containing protein [Acidimicrobiia bacterium]
MDPQIYDQAFPYGFVVDADHKVISAGPALVKLAGHHLVGLTVEALFDVKLLSGFDPGAPVGHWCGVPVSLNLIDPPVRLVGSFLRLDSGVSFAGSLGVEELLRLDDLGLTEDDFAPHDLTLEHGRTLDASRRRSMRTREVMAELEESRVLKEILHQKAHTDQLTGVGNRSAFVEALDQAVAADKGTSNGRPGSGSNLVVMIVDIDRFKSINDLHGHLAGDETLRLVADHLAESVGDSGLVARLGGDEFGILLPALPDDEDLRRTIDRIVSIRGRHFVVDGATIPIRITLGVVIRRGEVSGNELLRHADIAMYEARRTHQQPVCIFNPAARRNLEIRRAIRRDLLDALAQQKVRIVYQPEVDLATGLATKLEAFVRWDHPGFGIIQTEMFIDEVERCQMIQRLTRYVLRQATRDALQHFQTDVGPMALSINLSRLSIVDTLPAEIDQVLGLSGFPAELLTLEITEVGNDQDLQRVAPVLSDVAGIGVTIALDDFGTGHSSLKNLSQLPIGAVKMDGTFTGSTSSSRKALELVRATLHICEMLELPVVAEGVETAEHAQLFRAMGFQFGQGYYFGRPMPVERMSAFIGQPLPRSRRRSTDDISEVGAGDSVGNIDVLTDDILALNQEA